LSREKRTPRGATRGREFHLEVRPLDALSKVIGALDPRIRAERDHARKRCKGEGARREHHRRRIKIETFFQQTRRKREDDEVVRSWEGGGVNDGESISSLEDGEQRVFPTNKEMTLIRTDGAIEKSKRPCSRPPLLTRTKSSDL